MALSPSLSLRIDVVVELLRVSRSLLLITGAGLSADSGLPTYRGLGGLYERDANAQSQPIEAILSAEGFRRDPSAVWRHLGRVEQACRHSRPNRGHQVIAAMEQAFERVWVLTQNIDGFHQQAGSRNVIAIHGNLHQLRCCSCPYRTRVESYAGLDASLRCPDCGSSMRPDVVLFGEELDPVAAELYRREIPEPFDLVISIGTSSLFPYISTPVYVAARERRHTVEINPRRTELSDLVELRLRSRAEPTLTTLWERYQAKQR